jgi:hypothetical protein
VERLQKARGKAPLVTPAGHGRTTAAQDYDRVPRRHPPKGSSAVRTARLHAGTERSTRGAVAVIVVAQLFGTSLWFSPNSAAADLVRDWSLTSAQFGWLTSATQLGFIVGTWRSPFRAWPIAIRPAASSRRVHCSAPA